MRNPNLFFLKKTIWVFFLQKQISVGTWVQDAGIRVRFCPAFLYGGVGAGGVGAGGDCPRAAGGGSRGGPDS